jgi:hypothetical protein
MELDTELKYYESHRSDLLKAHRGQVVLIKGETLEGIFPSEEEAYKAAVRQFGNLPFLIARVEEGPAPHPVGQRLLRQMGFLAQAGMSDEDIDRFVAAIYKERSRQYPRKVDFG